MGLAQILTTGSYRTYEEWKLRICTTLARKFLSSYRTYEEWKLELSMADLFEAVGSYRTYEEWKHLTKLVRR